MNESKKYLMACYVGIICIQQAGIVYQLATNGIPNLVLVVGHLVTVLAFGIAGGEQKRP